MLHIVLLPLLSSLIFFLIGFFVASWLRAPISQQEKNLPLEGEASEISLRTSVPSEAKKPEPPVDEALNSVVDQVRDLANGMRTEVRAHSESVEQINHDLVTISNVSDPEAVTRVISRLMEANRHLDSRLNVAEARLQEQSQLLRSHRVEARTDALTGLPNRRVFDEQLQRLFDEYRHSQIPASLIMVDIDHFKTFNDQHGHQAGDACLKKVGEVISQAVRAIGGTAMRYGGEEFAVLLPATELFDAKVNSRRINQNIEALVVEYEGEDLQITASLGIAEIGRDSGPDEWLGRADRALYAAKRRGRNRACWHDGKNCQEVSQRKVDPETKISEEENTKGRRETFLADVNRRLALFHRKQQPLALILASIDQIDSEPIDRHPDYGTIQNAVTQVFKAVLRDMDHICQLAHNQFGALLPAAGCEEATSVAERVREAISRLELKTPTDMVRITISCGVSEALEGDDASHLVGRCEAGLQSASEHGGNAVYRVKNEMEWTSPKRVTSEAVIAN
ncbi:diguanylate cyclase [bacterium]|nr:diguanylate cyclase [bacterium]